MMAMARTTVKGVGKLAEALGLHRSTVSRYRNSGILKPATLSEYKGIIIFDLEKVYQCLNHRPVRPGRPALR